MLKFTSIFLLFFLFGIQTFAQTATIKVEVTDIQTIRGKLRMGVFNHVHDFRTKSNPYLRTSQVVKDSTANFVFKDVPYDRYAIAVYHDENNDDTLNTKKLGIPIEGVGFSGKFNSRIKPPDFPLASFRLKNDTTIVINLIYSKHNDR